MRMLEYEGKALLGQYTLPLPPEKVAFTLAEAKSAGKDLGYPVVVKAQVLAGGRGKAGGIKLAKTEEELEKAWTNILGMEIKGEICSCLLIAKAIPISQEFYTGLTIDPQIGLPVLMFSTAGGIDIEEVAANTPELLHKMHISLLSPPNFWDIMNFLLPAKLESALLLKVAQALDNLVDCFLKTTALTMEINPLVLTQTGEVLALDAKVVLDKDALSRLNIPQTDGLPQTDLEKRATAIGVRYVQLEGEVAVLGGGAGLGMATMDLVHYFGRNPACFIDCGGGITSEATAEAMRICLDTPGAKGVIFNAFGGGNNCETMAKGVVEALKDRPEAKVMVKMRGHSQDEGWALLQAHKIPYVTSETSSEAMLRLINQIYGA